MTPTGESPFLSVRINTKTYNPASTPVLSDVAFAVPKGLFVSLLGPSGCGKTTLLRMIAGLDDQYNGEIKIDGMRVDGPARQAGIMFQEARLLGWKTVEQNVDFALPHGLDPLKRRRMVDHALDLVGLSAARRAWPSQISGGMERRTALARAIVNLPSLLLLDEPFSALDYASKTKLWNEIEDIHRRENLTTLLVTHDIEEALYLSDVMIFLDKNPATIVRKTSVDIGRPRAGFMVEISLKRADMLARLKE
jgi:ABC-type nitrate/sulfonate/bicarbonate transport system ATPase subunit